MGAQRTQATNHGLCYCIPRRRFVFTLASGHPCRADRSADAGTRIVEHLVPHVVADLSGRRRSLPW